MPSGLPVATVAIDGAANAAILAAQIIAVSDAALLEKLLSAREDMRRDVLNKDQKLAVD
jgi:5-(carboxyamino)imidazole ribonucleotide mutase